ncbi:MAG TPA: glycosyltransferase family 4 protein [Tepidisphaeraceae bacterium]|jgi:protein O-GlcNAc transferase|nr:glycosyltransferase family 4 protein [Tepidisphaeraceae bacterium]
MRTFYFYCPIHFEKWDHRSPENPGIGGSETSVVEMARRLAARGHVVTVYAPLRDNCPEYDGNARWLPLEAADFAAPGVWVLSRCPSALDNFPVDHPEQTTWLVCQDVCYPDQFFASGWKDNPQGISAERITKLDRCLALCKAQAEYLVQRSPTLEGKIHLSSNGINVERIEGIKQIGRDPFKLIYSSSPDRGLPSLLKIFRRAREFEPRLSLTVAYGWDNIKKCKKKYWAVRRACGDRTKPPVEIDDQGKYWQNVEAECGPGLEQPGVTWLGRIGQTQLDREFLSAGLWVYPTTFTETSCITCMSAQACGAIPITNPLWALADNVRHGIFINGDPANEPLVMAQYVHEIRRLTSDLSLQEQIRGPMMEWARAKFDWERIVDQYEQWAEVMEEVACS